MRSEADGHPRLHLNLTWSVWVRSEADGHPRLHLNLTWSVRVRSEADGHPRLHLNLTWTHCQLALVLRSSEADDDRIDYHVLERYYEYYYYE